MIMIWRASSAAVNGFGLVEPEWDEIYRHLQILARHRRDLVKKRAKLQSQIRQALESCLPGYADLFPEDDLWKRPVPMAVARHAVHPEVIRAAGISAVQRWLAEDKLRVQARIKAHFKNEIASCPPVQWLSIRC